VTPGRAATDDHGPVDTANMLARIPAPLRPAVEFGRRCLARFIELEGFDRGMALAGQAFAALLPLLIVISALSPDDGRDVTDTLIEEFRLSGSAADALSTALARPTGPESGVSVLSFAILAISALSFTRAMQRLYVRAWRLPKLGVRGNVWGLAWLAAFVVWTSLQPVLIELFDGIVAFVVAEALATGLWLMTPWVLVGGRLPWLRLLPQAVLTAFGLLCVSIAAAVYAPRAISSASQDFGVIGVAFTLLTLLFLITMVTVIAAAIGATLAEWNEERRAR
jgi:membrane protein